MGIYNQGWAARCDGCGQQLRSEVKGFDLHSECRSWALKKGWLHKYKKWFCFEGCLNEWYEHNKGDSKKDVSDV